MCIQMFSCVTTAKRANANNAHNFQTFLFHLVRFVRRTKKKIIFSCDWDQFKISKKWTGWIGSGTNNKFKTVWNINSLITWRKQKICLSRIVNVTSISIFVYRIKGNNWTCSRSRVLWDIFRIETSKWPVKSVLLRSFSFYALEGNILFLFVCRCCLFGFKC